MDSAQLEKHKSPLKMEIFILFFAAHCSGRLPLQYTISLPHALVDCM